MEAIMKQIQHQLKQKQEQKLAMMKQLETIKKEEEQLQQTLQILSTQFTPVKEDAEKSTGSSTIPPTPTIQQISSKNTDKQQEKPSSSTCNSQEIFKTHQQSTDAQTKKWYVIFNGPHKGIYNDWGIANSHIVGKNVTHKSYKTKAEAETAFREAYKTVTTETVEKSSKTSILGTLLKTEPQPKSSSPTSYTIYQRKRINEKTNHRKIRKVMG
ncbi:hypothetical protein L2E82_09212 [Cichorium intybus]|uniref:Uncharacterized protein n=1 Tax=Cichorium intybus TaxID=13427 RepID=A0ACB9G8U4_CICIN|nr:hypothetical protein L2E82_09212 [Cichorium intybus]